jgi:hypothetical protein
MHYSRFLIPVLIAGALAQAGCSDGVGPGPQLNSGTFTTDHNSYLPYQGVVVGVPTRSLSTGARLVGKLGEITVALGKATDSTLVFMMPGSASGTAPVLSFTIGDTAYAGAITVGTAQPVQNPAQYLTAVQQQLRKTIVAARAGVEQDTLSYDKQKALSLLQAAQDSLTKYEQALTQLTPAEREVLANFLHVNLGSRLSAYSITNSASLAHTSGLSLSAAPGEGWWKGIPHQCRTKPTSVTQYSCTWGVFGGHLKEIAQLGTLAYFASLTIPGTGAVGIAVAGVIGGLAGLEALDALITGYVLMRWTAFAAWNVAEIVVDAASPHFRIQLLAPNRNVSPSEANFALAAAAPASHSEMAQSSLTEMTQNQPVAFSFAAQHRTVQASDAGTSVSWMGSALRAINTYNDFARRYLGERFTLSYAAPAAEWIAPTAASEISVAVVSNTKVRLASFGGNPGRFEMTFSSDEKTPQPFTYDIIYNGGVYPAVRVRRQATLNPANVCAQFAAKFPGNWTKTDYLDYGLTTKHNDTRVIFRADGIFTDTTRYYYSTGSTVTLPPNGGKWRCGFQNKEQIVLDWGPTTPYMEYFDIDVNNANVMRGYRCPQYGHCSQQYHVVLTRQ